MDRRTRVPEARTEEDADDEIAFHLESRASELIATGQTPEIARRNAEAEFGDVRAARRELAGMEQQLRRRERLAWRADIVIQHLRYAVRSLRRSPAFTLTAVATLAIGIGASAAIFTVVDGVLLRPLPFPSPDRLVSARHDLPPLGMKDLPQAVATYVTYGRLAHSIEAIGVYKEGEANVAELGSVDQPERLAVARISATLLAVLRVSPAIGHAFTAVEDSPGAPPVVLIADGLWRSRFGGDPRVVGRTLDVDGATYVIVGVMAAGFRFPAAAIQLWIPLQLDPVNPPPAAFYYTGIARLKPGVSIAEAQRDFAAVLPRAPEVVPNFVPGLTTKTMMDEMHPVPVLKPLRGDITSGITGTLWTVAAAALLVLLVACANVANLTLVRADARQRELAVREALGAGRARILLHFMAESAVLSTIAAALGLLAAQAAIHALVAASPAGIPRLSEVGLGGRTIGFTCVVALLVAAACSALPALRMGGGSVTARAGERSGTAGKAQHRIRGALVTAQIALALVVLASAGLLVRTFELLHAVRPGFEPDGVSTYWVSLPPSVYRTDTSIVRFYAQLIDRVAALPGVSVVGLTSRLPFETHGNNQNPIYPEGDPSYANKLPPLQLFTTVNGDYFRTMGIPLVAGKTFEPMDAQRDGEAIISRSTARFFWHDSTGTTVLGKRFRPLPTARWYSVIGVVGDTRDTALAAPPSLGVYFPETLEQGGAFTEVRRVMGLALRSSEGGALTPAVRDAVHALDPALPLFDVRPMNAVLAAATAQLSFIILILGGAAVVTLILGAVGLYGALAYIVTLRTREMGIRLALGATPWAVAVAMTRYGVGLTGIGIALGLALFALVARFLSAMLFGVAAGDPVTLGAAALVLLVVALAASWGPARRAARVDPAETLRGQ